VRRARLVCSTCADSRRSCATTPSRSTCWRTRRHAAACTCTA
jgi:hypothetical protein